ncbi:hypothetical protein ABIA33_006980 [Streptacidiphilus sp. MAP12-16]|uniref:DUF4331 family protein n=1 Tax=Streptacidiphilus sp. MAP12-16 TaxID=3156300 RepID=UPI003511908D
MAEHAPGDVARLLAAEGYRVIVPHLRGYGSTTFLSPNTFRNAQQAVVPFAPWELPPASRHQPHPDLLGHQLPYGVDMSNHFSAAYLKFPGNDARLDLTDLYVFPASGDSSRTVLIIDVNPFMTGMSATPPFLMVSEFHPDAVYRINIDNDGDNQADVAFSFVFTAAKDGGQAGTAFYATGTDAQKAEATGEVLASAAPVGFDATAQPVQAGPCRLFIGVRSDPFFADAEGALHGFQWTGEDAFARKDVQCIALEVPDEMLGPESVIGVWATVSVRRDGALFQVDRGGHPTINPFINPEYAKDAYNAGHPADDAAKYLEPWSKLLEGNGYSPAGASAAAGSVLPDILRYDRNRPTAYPNGRTLTDDVFSARMAFLTNGKVKSDGLSPHDDLLTEFPYLGLPHGLPHT